MRKWGWNFVLVPGIMGLFFGIGHFLAYLFFSYEGFKKAETKVNSVLKDLL